MHDEFEISMMGELNFFLGLQIKQIEEVIFFNQSKYIEMLKKFGLEDSKPTMTLMLIEIKLTKDDEADSVDSSKHRVYADSDHVGDYIDYKSSSGVCTFMGCCITSWFAKKQMALAISMMEAEYVSAKKNGRDVGRVGDPILLANLIRRQELVHFGIHLEVLVYRFDLVCGLWSGSRLILSFLHSSSYVGLLLKNTTPPRASVKAVEESCVTCGGPLPDYQCLATDGNAFPGYHDNIQANFVL
nr:hypothetical protein [Tanacetum cinerariifolium]